MAEMNHYIVAVARHARDTIPGNWLETLTAVEGVKIEQQGGFTAKVLATPEGVEGIKRLFGGVLLVEQPIERRAL